MFRQKTPHTLLAFSTGHQSVQTAPTGRSPRPGLQSMDRCCGHVCNTQPYTSTLLQQAQTLQGAPVGAANMQLLRRWAQWVASQTKCSALWACCALGLGFTGVLLCARLTQWAQFIDGSLVCCAVHCAWSMCATRRPSKGSRAMANSEYGITTGVKGGQEAVLSRAKWADWLAIAGMLRHTSLIS